MYTGPLDSEVVESMNDCDPEVRHVISCMNLLNSYKNFKIDLRAHLRIIDGYQEVNSSNILVRVYDCY